MVYINIKLFQSRIHNKEEGFFFSAYCVAIGKNLASNVNASKVT